MSSIVSLCNQALLRVGGSTIASLEEASREALLCRTFFDACRDSVLRDCPWNFAAARRLLALKPETVAPWRFSYGYPSDCLAAREIDRPVPTAPPIPFEIAADSSGERVVCTNQPQAVLIYTVRVLDPGTADPLFCEALSWKLATELAWPLSQNAALTQVTAQAYREALSRARAADANEAERQSTAAATWIEARL